MNQIAPIWDSDNEFILYDRPTKYTQKQINYLSQFSDSTLQNDRSWTRWKNWEEDVLSIDEESTSKRFGTTRDVIHHIKYSIVEHGAAVFSMLDIIWEAIDQPKDLLKKLTLGLMLMSAGISRSDRHTAQDIISQQKQQTIEILWYQAPQETITKDVHMPHLEDISNYDSLAEWNVADLSTDIVDTYHIADEGFLFEMMTVYAQIPGMDMDRVRDAVNHLHQAIYRLQSNPTFADQWHVTQDLMQQMLPLMIKESSLIPDVIQKKSKAKWYCQLLPGARADAADYIRNTLWVSKTYNVMDPVDNIILGTVYFNCCLPRYFSKWDDQKTFEKVFAEHDVQKFVQVAYNAWPGAMRALTKKYRTETKSVWKIARDDFAYWLVSKVDGLDGRNIKEKNEWLWIEYTNWFVDSAIRKKLVESRKSDKVDRLIPKIISKSKLVEIIDYAEVIWALGKANFIFPTDAI